MFNATINDEGMPAGSQLRLPLQAAPVNRAALASTLSAESGIQPSFEIESFLAGLGLGSIIAVLS